MSTDQRYAHEWVETELRAATKRERRESDGSKSVTVIGSATTAATTATTTVAGAHSPHRTYIYLPPPRNVQFLFGIERGGYTSL